MIDEVRVLGRHDRALQMLADLIVGHPFVLQSGLWVMLAQLTQRLLHDRGAARVVKAIPDDQDEEADLIEQNQQHRCEQPGFEETEDFHAAGQAPRSSSRSAASTAVVSGSTASVPRGPRRRVCARTAAWPTSRPGPSPVWAAPAAAACCMNGVGVGPWTMP